MLTLPLPILRPEGHFLRDFFSLLMRVTPRKVRPLGVSTTQRAYPTEKASGERPWTLELANIVNRSQENDWTL